MRKRNAFDRTTNTYLEEQIRSYPELNFQIATAKLLGNENAEDYYNQLKLDIEKTMKVLPDNLQELIEDYFWGDNRNVRDWDTIGYRCLMSKRNGHAARTQIIEEFAKIRGILIR